MRVLSAKQITIWNVEVGGTEYTYYIRNGPDDWRVTMGESMEPVYFCEQLEQEFQEWLARSGETAA